MKQTISRLMTWMLALGLVLGGGVAAAQETGPEAEYVQVMTEQTGLFDESYANFNTYMDRLNEGPPDSEGYMLVEEMIVEVGIWQDIAVIARQTDAPATCEAAGTAATAWGDELDGLADAWDGLYSGDRGADAAFTEQAEAVDTSRAELDEALADCAETAGIATTESDATPAADDDATSASTLKDITRVKRPNDLGQPTPDPEDTATEEATEEAVADPTEEATAEPTEASTGDTVTVVFEASGAEIEVADGLLAEDPEDAAESNMAILSTSTTGLAAVAVLPADGGARVTRDAFVEGFAGEVDNTQEISLGGNNRVATGLYLVNLGAGEHLMFVHVDTTTLPGYHIIQVIIGTPDEFVEEFELVSESVTIDGVPMFDGLEPEDIVSEYTP